MARCAATLPSIRRLPASARRPSLLSSLDAVSHQQNVGSPSITPRPGLANHHQPLATLTVDNGATSKPSYVSTAVLVELGCCRTWSPTGVGSPWWTLLCWCSLFSFIHVGAVLWKLLAESGPITSTGMGMPSFKHHGFLLASINSQVTDYHTTWWLTVKLKTTMFHFETRLEGESYHMRLSCMSSVCFPNG